MRVSAVHNAASAAVASLVVVAEDSRLLRDGDRLQPVRIIAAQRSTQSAVA